MMPTSEVVLTPRPRARTRILVVAEKGVMRDGLCALLGSTEEFEVAGTESSAAEALRSAVSLRPDIVVADFPPSRQHGPELILGLRACLPKARVLVLTFSRDERPIGAALRAGAHGYMHKSDSCNELFTALRSIAAGKGFISPSICDRIASGYACTRQAPEDSADAARTLTERERQVMRLIAAGQRTREIAQQLSLSHKTIEKHRSSLMRKLGLRNASAVAAHAVANGIGDT